MRYITARLSPLVLIATTMAVAACSTGSELKIPRKKATGEVGRKYETDERQTLFGEGGIFGDSGKQGPAAGSGGGLNVNSYLWRATLDTIAFMPIASADPFGGVIITDWYSPAETPSERFKLNVIIRDRALTADGVKITLFRQILDQTGAWRDAQVQPDAGRKLEDAVLTRARQLRNETRMLAN